MDTLIAMRTFVSIVDHGSLTAAAEALDRSQPAVVRSLAALEAHLGVRLLQRTTRRMSLTPEGSEYLQRCRQILADVDEAERAVAQDQGELQGGLRMTAPVQFGRLHLAPLLTQFLARNPRISVDLMLIDRNVDLVDEGIDLALRIGKLKDSGLIALPVGEVERVVCASPALIAAEGEPKTPSDLEALPCVRLQNLARSSTWTFREGFRKQSIRVGGPLSCNHIGAAIAACVEGAGFGQFLSYQVHSLVQQRELVRVLEPFEERAIPVSLVYPGGRMATARQRALTTFLKQRLSERPL